ncbi:MAG: RNA-directed DNA polymerase [Bacteroidetes bacterium]|nr:RNA-directed DNA polymerase [Bacteroidota bacterium]
MDFFTNERLRALTEQMFEAYFECRKNKRNKHSALNFERQFETHVFLLAEDLFNERWAPKSARAFLVREPVLREVFAAEFRDRVVHHWLMARLVPLFEDLFIDDSYACRVGKGTHFGIQRLWAAMRFQSAYPKGGFVLKLDIQGFFMSISRELLWTRLDDFIQANYAEPDLELVLYTAKTLVLHDPVKNVRRIGNRKEWNQLPRSKSMFGTHHGHGLPIGNLSSQVFANFYLHPLDKFVKERLGIEFYGRYVDDFYLVHHSKHKLVQSMHEIRAFLAEELELELHPRKIYLQHLTKGVSFLGSFIRPTHVVPGKRFKGSLHGMIDAVNADAHNAEDPARVEAVRNRLNAYWGLTHGFSAYRLRKKSWRRLDGRWKKKLKPSVGLRKTTIYRLLFIFRLPNTIQNHASRTPHLHVRHLPDHRFCFSSRSQPVDGSYRTSSDSSRLPLQP